MKPWIFAIPAALALLSGSAGAAPSVTTTLTLPDTNGVLHRPLAVGENRAVVLIFISNDCPISNGYAPEINRLQSVYAPQKIGFTLISVDQNVSTAAIKQHAAQYGYHCPDLQDSHRILVKQLGATVTPEAFVYGPGGKLLYHGRIDDKYADFGKVRFTPRTHDLQQALESIVADKPVPHPTTKAVGCFL